LDGARAGAHASVVMALAGFEAERPPMISAAVVGAAAGATGHADGGDGDSDRPLLEPAAAFVLEGATDLAGGAATASPASSRTLRLGLLAAGEAGAPTRNPVVAGIDSSFAFPVGDLFVRRHDSPILALLDNVTLGSGLALPISAHRVGTGNSGDRLSGSPALSFGLHYQPVGFWYAQITGVTYLEEGKRSAWNGDFTYGFGYDDYHPYTFSLAYSNYGNNRVTPAPHEPISQLDHGAISLAWKAPLPYVFARPFLFDQTLSINCHIGVDASPRYDTSAGRTENWKTSASLGCSYPFTAHLFAGLNASVYGHGQQPWDPDFTYTFGLADYRSDHFSIIYANYSGNRYPGRRNAAGTGRFLDGGVFINWNHGF
jgi:hypothetical protein